MGKQLRPLIVAFAVTLTLLALNGHFHNQWLWGFAGMGIGVQAGLLIAYLVSD